MSRAWDEDEELWRVLTDGHSTVLTDGQADRLTLHGRGTVGRVMANVLNGKAAREGASRLVHALVESSV